MAARTRHRTSGWSYGLIGLGMAASSLMLLGASASTSLAAPPHLTPVSKRKPAQIHFEVTPGSVVIFLDGKRLGAASQVGKVASAPGRRVIRLVRGQDETQMEVTVRRSEILSFRYDFSD